MKVLLLEEIDEDMQLSDRQLSDRMFLPAKDIYSRFTGSGFTCTDRYLLVFLDNMRLESFHVLGYVV